MPLTPLLQEYVDSVEKLKKSLLSDGFKPNHVNEREAIASFTAKYMTETNDDISAVDDVVFTANYPIAVRIYSPDFEKKLPVVVYIHGGGHMTGGIVVYDKIIKKLSKKMNAVVVSVEYRLSPEFGYPVGLYDCKTVISHIFDVLDRQNISYRNKELIIIGDSSGGTFCATIAADIEFVKKYKIKKQLLICPLLDYTLSSDSAKRFQNGYLLDINELNFYSSNYFQNNEDLKTVSPLFGFFHRDIPETLVLLAEYDPLFDDGIRYIDRLKDANGVGSFFEIKNVVHPFLMLEDLCKEECELAYRKIIDFIVDEAKKEIQ